MLRYGEAQGVKSEESLTGSGLISSPSWESDCWKGMCKSGNQIGNDLGKGPSVPWTPSFKLMPYRLASSGSGGTRPSVFVALEIKRETKQSY